MNSKEKTMQILYKILTLLLVLLSGSLSAQWEDSLSLDLFLALAKNQNIQVEAAKLDRNQAALRNDIVQARLRPNIQLNANLPNYQRTSQEVLQPDGTIRFQTVRNNNSALGVTLTQNIPQTGGRLFIRSDLQRFDDFGSNSKVYNGVPVRIGLFQPILGFNELKWDKQLAPVRLEEANKKYQSDLENIQLDATRLFFELIIARMDLEIANSNVTNNEALFEIAEERHALGKISDSDLLQLRVSLVNAKRSQQRAQQAVRLSSSDIYTFLGVKYDGTLLRAARPEAVTDLEVDTEMALNKARELRFETTAFQRMQLEAERDVAEAKGNGGFQAALSASFGLTRAAGQLADVYQAPQNEQFAQVTLSVPIIDWGRQKATVDIAKAQQDYTQRFVQQEEARFETEIRQAVAQFNSVQAELRLARDLRDLAEERFQIARESFVLGAISITELTIAQQEKDQAKRTYVFVLGQYWISYYQLSALTLYDIQ